MDKNIQEKQNFFKNLSKKEKEFASNIFANVEIFTRPALQTFDNGSSISGESGKCVLV